MLYFCKVNIRKYIQVVVAILLLVSNNSFSFTVHYCGDSLAAISLSSAAPKQEVDCCGKKIIKSSCCKDKKIVIEKKTDQSILKDFSYPLTMPAVPYSWQSNATRVFITDIPTPKYVYTGETNAPPLYQLYSQFLFYA